MLLAFGEGLGVFESGLALLTLLSSLLLLLLLFLIMHLPSSLVQPFLLPLH